jgi:hypothetical protein
MRFLHFKSKNFPLTFCPSPLPSPRWGEGEGGRGERRKESLMKHSLKNLLAEISLVTLTVFFLFGCASQSKTAQPEATPEQQKPASETSIQETIPPPPPATPTTATTSPPPSPPSTTPEVSRPIAQHATEIALSFVNLRQGPSMDSRIIRVLKKGTKLTALQQKGGWLRVQLEDGTEGWVGKTMTSEGTQPKSP